MVAVVTGQDIRNLGSMPIYSVIAPIELCISQVLRHGSCPAFPFPPRFFISYDFLPVFSVTA
jgi:hypothetical protein